METMQALQTISAARLMHEPVRNPEGERIGRIEDYMIDAHAGCIDYAILSFGGFLGMGSKLFLVPWTLLRIDRDEGAFTMSVTKEQLERAPGFEHGNAPDLTNSEYVESVFGFWGVDYPYAQGRTRAVAQTQGDAPEYPVPSGLERERESGRR